MVERAFATETAAFRAGDLYGRMHGARRSATNSFEIGLARGICDKLRAMRAARDEVAKLGLDLRAREMGQRSRRVLTDAFQAGKAAGQRCEFAPAITRAA